MVHAVFIKLAGRAIQAQHNLLACGETGFVDSVQNHLDGRFMTRHIRGKAAFVAHGGAHTFVTHDFLQGMKHFSAVAQGFAKIGSAHGNDHQLLQVEVVIGVCASIDHIHHGNRHLHAPHATEIAVQRKPRLFGSSPCHSHGDSQNGIRT